jgi:hypothetical protein
MAMTPKRSASWATRLFGFVLLLTLGVYGLRGVAILTMIPGGILWILFLLSLATGILAILVNLRRSY